MSACEHYQQQISQLLDGELPPEQVQTLRAHLRTCPECQRVYDGFRRFRPPSVTRPPRRPPT